MLSELNVKRIFMKSHDSLNHPEFPYEGHDDEKKGTKI